MMDFQWSEEQMAFKEAVRKFAEKEISPGALERDVTGRFNRDAWSKAGEFGLLGLPIPQTYGGGGCDVLTTMAAMEGLGLGCRDTGFSLAVQAHMVICEVPIWQHGSEDQRSRYLPRLCRGEWIGACGMTEPDAGSDLLNIRTSARRDGDRYVLNGTKIFISNGPIANLVLVFATVDRAKRARGMTAFLVEKGFPGFSVSRELEKMGARSNPTGELVFEECVVPVENRLGEEGDGMSILLDTLEWERALVLTTSVGRMEYQLGKCLRYAKERVQFGRPIGEFQLVQEKLANMKVRLEAARLLAYKAGWMKQNRIPSLMEACIAKLFISEANVQSSLDAIQIHGGYGFMREYEVERNLRDAVGATVAGGTSEIQRLTIARELFRGLE